MTPEERKEYNKIYYSKRKEELIKNGCAKVKCEYCDKEITKNRLDEHIKSKICVNRIKLNKKKKEREKLNLYKTIKIN